MQHCRWYAGKYFQWQWWEQWCPTQFLQQQGRAWTHYPWNQGMWMVMGYFQRMRPQKLKLILRMPRKALWRIHSTEDQMRQTTMRSMMQWSMFKSANILKKAPMLSRYISCCTKTMEYLFHDFLKVGGFSNLNHWYMLLFVIAKHHGDDSQFLGALISFICVILHWNNMSIETLLSCNTF